MQKGEYDMDNVSIYGSVEQLTIDREWTYEELADNIDDECIKLVPDYANKHKFRAVYDENLYKPQYVAEKIKNENDLIEVYNKEYDKHRYEDMFGIVWFDKWIESQVRRIMNANLVGGKK